MNSINMKLVKVNGKTREDLLVALANLGEMDCDFNGENGIEYLWDDVDNTKIQKFKKEWFEYQEANLADLSQRLNEGAPLSDEDKKLLTETLTTFKSSLFNA